MDQHKWIDRRRVVRAEETTCEHCGAVRKWLLGHHYSKYRARGSDKWTREQPECDAVFSES
jgi:hypothetical protein